jgi:hypothetical protein
MPRWAHSRKATFSRVYAVKSVDPFCFRVVLAKLGPGFVFLEGKKGWMEVKGWNWRDWKKRLNRLPHRVSKCVSCYTNLILLKYRQTGL